MLHPKKSKFFTKLDRRNNGYGHWGYYVNKPKNFVSLYESHQLFFSWREWCWQTWGASKEIDDWLKDTRQTSKTPTCHNEFWCFQNNEYGCRIYLRTDKELSMFLLKWA